MAWGTRLIFLFRTAYPDLNPETDATCIVHFWKHLSNRKLSGSVGRFPLDTMTQAIQLAMKHLQVIDHEKGTGHNPNLYNKLYAIEGAPTAESSDEEEEGGVNAASKPPVKKKTKKTTEQTEEADKDVVCWNCGKTGHFQRNCPKPN